MAQVCECPRASNRSSSYVVIANNFSSAVYSNYAQILTTAGNNCGITTVCALVNTANPRRRHKFSSSSRSLHGDLSAPNTGNTIAPHIHLWNFDLVTSALYGAYSYQYLTNYVGITGVYVSTQFIFTQPHVFNNRIQLQPN